MSDLLEYKGYFGSVQFSSEDDALYGKLVGIDDLIHYRGGKSIRDLKKAFHEAVDDYLETCEGLGKEPNKMYKGSFNIRISPELHRSAAMFATANDISLNDFVKTAIRYSLKHKEDLRKEIASNI